MKTDRKPHPLVVATLARAEREAGRPVDPLAAFGWLAELDKLARSIDAPPVEDRAADLDVPVMCGGIAFYRPSWATFDLFEKLEGCDPATESIGVLWALAHARDLVATRKAIGTPYRELRALLRAWALEIPAPVEALQAVAAELLRRRRDPGGKRDDTAPNFGSVVSGLIAEYGQTPEYWATCSIDILRQRLEDAAARRDHETRSAARASGVPAPPDPDGWSARAQRRYNAKAAAFIAWHKA